MAKNIYSYRGETKTSEGKVAFINGDSKPTKETLAEFAARFERNNPHVRLTSIMTSIHC